MSIIEITYEYMEILTSIEYLYTRENLTTLQTHTEFSIKFSNKKQ
jgi:hypothetical protein